MKLTLGFSPCPNDTFIFDALLHQKIDTEGIEFVPIIEDVETLNNLALKAELDITKISFFAFGFVTENYQLLTSGSALGNNCGPLLISKRKIEISALESENISVAIPGKLTTANFLLSLFFPNLLNKKEMIFSEIENALINGNADAGLIIHENRFTYQQKGLLKIIDLGEEWEKRTKLPIPLGGISIKRGLPDDLKQKVNRVLKRSVDFALANPESSKEYVKCHSQSLEDHVIQQHIRLYVHHFTSDLGEKGKSAIQFLFEKAQSENLIPEIKHPLFIV